MDRVKVKQEVEAAKEDLQEIQEEETSRSLCSMEDQEGERRVCGGGGNGKKCWERIIRENLFCPAWKTVN